MSSHWFGLIELLLVFGLILGWAGWQWWGWRRWRQRESRRDGLSKERVEPDDLKP